MKKKFINVLLLLAVSGASCSTFTSCKDTDNDLRVEWTQADQDLQKKVDQLSAELEAVKTAGETCRTECQKKIADILLKLAEADGKISENAGEISKLKIQINQISIQITDILTKLDKQLTVDDVKNIFEQYTVDYYKNLGLLTADDIKGTLTDIANLTQSVKDLEKNYNNLNVLVTNINNNYQQLIKDLTDGKYGPSEEEAKKFVNDLIDKQVVILKTLISETEKNLNALIAANTEEINKLKGTSQNHEIRIADLEKRVAALEETVKKFAEIEKEISEIKTRLTVTEEKAISAYELAQQNQQKLTILEGLIGDCTGLKPLADEIRDLQTKYADLDDKINSVNTDLLDKISALDGKIDAINTALGQDISDLEKRVAANESAIQELQLKVNKLLQLEDRINSLITSVLVQGTFNPLFGTFSLPIGVQSNILVNYYGLSNNQTYEFPSVQKIATYNNEDQITSAELRMLEASGYEHVTIENGAVLFDSKDGNLGKVFVTINPNNINFEGQNLTLVNSIDEQSAVELRNLRPSKEVLKFGYSRGGGSNNGFYEADATLPANIEDINATAIHIHENLKSSMKQILEDRRNNLRSNIIGLMRAVYDQFNGILPAYAMKAGWTVNGESYAVYSNYNIAATTFKPLSYKFLYGTHISPVLPIIDPITESILNLNPDDYKFNFKDIKVDFSDIENAKLDINIDPISLSYTGELTVTVTGNVYDENGQIIGKTTLTGEINPDDLDSFLKSIEKEFNNKIGSWNESIRSAYEKSIKELMKNVNKGVEDMLAQLQGEVNEKISDMISSIQDEVNGKVGSYIGKFNDFIDKYNSLANRLNDLLENPNHFLQPTMLYSTGNGPHFLSGNINKPTTFRKAGGDGITLYATSYTGEVLAPAYKKMVACVNVIDNATKKTAQNNGGELLDELKSINKTQFIGEVCQGSQRRFPISVAGLKSGHTYEILYTAVDYLGVTSTARFYFTLAD